jgi:hypothetical protein
MAVEHTVYSTTSGSVRTTRVSVRHEWTYDTSGPTFGTRVRTRVRTVLCVLHDVLHDVLHVYVRTMVRTYGRAIVLQYLTHPPIPTTRIELPWWL